MTRQHFDGDDTFQPYVAGAIDLSHAARTQWRLNFVGAEFRASGKGHACASLYCIARALRAIRRFWEDAYIMSLFIFASMLGCRYGAVVDLDRE